MDRERPTILRRPGRVLAYVAMLAAAVGLFWVIRMRGESLVAPLSDGPSAFRGSGAGAVADTDVLLHLLLALVAVVLVARLMGAWFARLNQPPVLGEIVAGILIGPSLLGRVAPEVAAFVLPPSVTPLVGVIAQVGIILYMFIVGMELDTSLLRKRTHASIAVSHASIVVPFLLGAAMALWLYPRLSTRDVPFGVFALFMGVSMSVTAFPVLARILTDRRMQSSPIGAIALACAAVDDVTAWCLLALLVGVVNAEPSSVLITIGLAAGYVVTMVLLVRPLAMRFVRRYQQNPRLTPGSFTVVCVALLLSALVTEIIGIHALFGAFFLGVLVPHDSRLAHDVKLRLEDLVLVLLLPAFFAFTGMRTQIGLVHGLEQWLVCGAIILVASIGKFGGSAVAARLTGLGWRPSMALGILMNTRGLMELIVLNIGLDLGVLSPTLFTMLVIMALVTTFATTPILHRLRVEEVEA